MDNNYLCDFLFSKKDILKHIIHKLKDELDYISVLATDCKGTSYKISKKESSVSDAYNTERGFVFRGQSEGRIAELALTSLPDNNASEEILSRLKTLVSMSEDGNEYSDLPDEPASASYFPTVRINPFSLEKEVIIKRLTDACAKIRNSSPHIINVFFYISFYHINKVFISPNRDLEQSYFLSDALGIFNIKGNDQRREFSWGVSGMKGLEIIDEFLEEGQASVSTALGLLDSRKVIPGEYDIIASPSISGLIAHEAFGHGVEMDMYVKGRALAAQFTGRKIAGPMVNMFDGASGIEHVGSYLFDDEGNFSKNTQIIKDGFLIEGISDMLSALKLKSIATGNGRRESFSRKAYARMTNTYFQPGDDSLDDMIASIKKGYLLDHTISGMEDPKNWGIQMVVCTGREIIDGKLTDNLVSPVVCTGYVPHVLSNITMISGDFKLTGNGYCQKGHKESVRASEGGPYIKTRLRLG